MPITAYGPIGDPSRNHRRHSQSRRFGRDLPAGKYVYVQDVYGIVWVLSHRDQQGHAHHVVLGRARCAVSAGELTLGPGGLVLQIDNQSGTFVPPPDTLLVAIGGLVRQGATFDENTLIEETPV